jgi:hypothetical protein
MSIKINGVTKEDTAYDKWIHFTYEGVEYHALLHWDNMDGYNLTFTDPVRIANWVKTPDWAVEWNEQYDNDYEDTLESILDGLTDEVLAGTY